MERVYLITTIVVSFTLNLSAQCLKGDCYNGNGIYVFKSGSKYQGKFQNGKIFEYGTLYFSNGSIYQGQWKNQSRNGIGKMTYKDGSFYIGHFANNQREGKGKYNFANGDVYDGEWKNDLQHGSGLYSYVNGRNEEGVWNNGKFVKLNNTDFTSISSDENKLQNTKVEKLKNCNKFNCGNSLGRYTYQDGSYYEGGFSAGIPDGKGICYYANGDRYEGYWKNNAPDGEGTMYFVSGTVYSALWSAGYPIKNILQNENSLASALDKDQDQVEYSEEVKIFAVIVGIASYNHMPTLKYTDDDAYQIYAFLKSPEGGAIPDERISLLIDESATRKNILFEMEKTFSRADENDVIMLYYSGHGLPGSFLPIDFDGYNNMLLHEEIKAILEKSHAKHKICFADACHSGSLLAMRSPFNAATTNSFFEGFENAKAGTALFTSSKSEEISMETSGLRQGIYSHFLIRGLAGEADFDFNKIVTITELYNYVNKNVRAYTSNRQTPVIAGNYDHNMPVAIVR